MDSEYLRQSVGPILVPCLAEVCEKRPSDPIEYIALWLHKHMLNVKEKEEELKEQEELARQREEYRLEQERLELCRLEEERLAKEEEERQKAIAEAEAAAAAAAAEKALPSVEENEEEEDEAGNEFRGVGNDENEESEEMILNASEENHIAASEVKSDVEEGEGE